MSSIIKEASKEMINSLDTEFEARKSKIRSTKSEWTLGKGGTVYYISHSGDDNNDGKSPKTAMATLTKINSECFLKEGDVVLFERGGRWHERIIARPYVTYSAYGVGDKPKICGSLDASSPDDWVKYGDKHGLYKYAHSLPGTPLTPDGICRPAYDIGNIIFNDGEAFALRIYDENLDNPGYCRQFGYNGIVSNGKEMWYRPKTKFTSPEDLNHDLEYYFNFETGELYLMSVNGNPGEVFERIDLAQKGNVVQATNGVTIDNLAILYGAQHGVGCGTCRDLTVRNSEIGWIGGALQFVSRTHHTRYGNSIEIYGTAQNFIVENCYIYQAFDCGPTVQWSGDLAKEDPKYGLKKHNKNIRFKGNAIERCDSPLEVWITTPTEPTEERYAMLEDIVISDNLCRYSGYGFGGYTHYKSDYNMFYGGGETKAKYKDAYVENNFMWHIRLFVHLAVPVNTRNGLGFNWRNNVIVKPYGSEFSSLGSDPENAKGKFKVYPYTDDSLKMLLDCGAVGDNRFYHYMRSELFDFKTIM